MPHIVTNSPFVSLQHDASCGRSEVTSFSSATDNEAPFASLSPRIATEVNGHTNGFTSNAVNGQANGTQSTPPFKETDQFLKLSQPQQDVLLLHGPGKRYSLERQRNIPDLKHDREILVQVLAIGLNPVDWKGPDYGSFSNEMAA